MILSGLFVYSASMRSPDSIPIEFKKQCIWFGLGVVGYFLVALIDYHWLSRKSWLFYLASLVLLLAVLKMGTTINGSKSWITIAGVQVQPSEFAKLAMLLALCQYFSLCEGILGEWRRLIFVTLIAAIPIVLILKQPDLGTALVSISLFFLLLFMAGAPLRLFVTLGILGFIFAGVVGYETLRYSRYRDEIAGTQPSTIRRFSEALPIETDRPPSVKALPIREVKKFKSILPLKPYQFNRILGLVAPDKLDPLREGWNSEQSKIAIGSGGISGKGWMKGDVTHGGYLPRPVAPSDFIFSVYAEETGFIGGSVLMILYAILLLGGVRIAMRARDQLGSLLACGVVFMLFIHIFVNMGMTLGILPIVGVPLPLMSYGGSFVLVCMMALGLLQSVWLHRKPY